MSIDSVINFGKVTVSPADNVAYQVTVSDASRFPDPATQPFNVVWYNDTDYPDPADDPNREIVRVIAVSGNVLTLANSDDSRVPQEGTAVSVKNLSAKTYKMILGITAKMIGDLNNTDNMVEGSTNLFYTQGRFDSAFGTKSTSNLSEGLNLYYTQSRFDSAFTAKTTDSLTEGSTNLYFTNSRADARITAQKAQANGLATLDSTGKIPSSQLPSIVVNQTYVVNSQSAMLALSADVGDLAIRTDLNETFILQASPSSTLSNWIQLLSPIAPVQSVNGLTGNVSLTTSNITEATNLYFTNNRAVSALTGANVSIFNNDAGYITSSALTPYFKLNQSTPQTISGGIPVFSSGVDFNQASAGGQVEVAYFRSTGSVANSPVVLGFWTDEGYGLQHRAYIQAAAGTSNNGYLAFQTRNNGTLTEGLRINNDQTLKFTGYATAGFVKTSSNGTVSIDTNTYLTTSAAATTYQPIGTYVTGATNSSLTLISTTLGINLANSNNFSTVQYINYTASGYFNPTSFGVGAPNAHPALAPNVEVIFSSRSASRRAFQISKLSGQTASLVQFTDEFGNAYFDQRANGDVSINSLLVGGNITLPGTNTYSFGTSAGSALFLRNTSSGQYPIYCATPGDLTAFNHTNPQALIHGIKTTEQLRLGYDTSNYWKATTGSTGGVTFDGAGTGASFTFNKKVNNTLPQNLKGYTVATLPTGVTGDVAYVTDALAPSFLATIVGGGAVTTPVFYNGSNWVGF